VTVLWLEGEHPRKKEERETTPSLKASKQARLPIPLKDRAGQEKWWEQRKAGKILKEWDWRTHKGSKRLSAMEVRLTPSLINDRK